MVRQVGQRAVQLLLQQRGALLRGGGRLLADAPVQGAGRGGLGADGVAPLAVVQHSGRVILCRGRAEEKEKHKLDLRKKCLSDEYELFNLVNAIFKFSKFQVGLITSNHSYYLAATSCKDS